MNLIVTIPAYNEEKTIGKVVKNISHILKKDKYDFKVIVVDDGSTDQTAKVAMDNGAIVYSQNINYGLAETFRTEIEKALAFDPDVIVHIDADGQYLAEEIPFLVKEVKNGYDLVLGSRIMGKIEDMPYIKKIGNIAFSKVISNITGIKITDAQTGFRAFSNKTAQKIKIISDHTYTQEQIIKAVKMKLRVKEVPITFKKRIDGKSRLINNPIEYAIKAWINILRIYRDFEPLKFFGAVGVVFFSMGFAIGLWFTFLHLTTGIVGHLGMALLMILSIVSGIQIILFGFLADMRK